MVKRRMKKSKKKVRKVSHHHRDFYLTLCVAIVAVVCIFVMLWATGALSFDSVDMAGQASRGLGGSSIGSSASSSSTASAGVASSGQFEWCKNGKDDDGDGLADCLDEVCDGQVGYVAPSNGEEHYCEFGEETICDDWFDNNGDGEKDCGDDDCDGKIGHIASDGTKYYCEYGRHVMIYLIMTKIISMIAVIVIAMQKLVDRTERSVVMGQNMIVMMVLIMILMEK